MGLFFNGEDGENVQPRVFVPVVPAVVCAAQRDDTVGVVASSETAGDDVRWVDLFLFAHAASSFVFDLVPLRCASGEPPAALHAATSSPGRSRYAAAAYNHSAVIHAGSARLHRTQRRPRALPVP